VRAQDPVFVSAWGVFTRLDLLMRDTRTRRLILVEVKTSAPALFNAENGQRFFAPLQDVPSTPKNHALAQLALTSLMYRMDPRCTLRFTEEFVVAVSDAGVRRYRPEPWCDRFKRFAAEILTLRCATLGPPRIPSRSAHPAKRHRPE
jgi:hypothetical protein